MYTRDLGNICNIYDAFPVRFTQIKLIDMIKLRVYYLVPVMS